MNELSLSSSFSLSYLSRGRWWDEAPISVADFLSVTLSPVYCGLFDEYSRLLPPVARALFDGAIRLLSSCRVSSRRRRRLLSGVSLRLCWSTLSVFLGPIASLSLASISSLPFLVVVASRFIFGLLLIFKDDGFLVKMIDGIGFDCRRSSFEIVDPVCDLNNREYGSFVNCSSSAWLCLTAEFRRVSSQIVAGRWSALSLTCVSERRAFVHVVGRVDAFLFGFPFLWACGPKCCYVLGPFVGPLFVCFCWAWFSLGHDPLIKF